MRVKIIRSFNGYQAGEVVTVSAVRAKLLIAQGYASATKDMSNKDYKTS